MYFNATDSATNTDRNQPITEQQIHPISARV